LRLQQAKAQLNSASLAEAKADCAEIWRPVPRRMRLRNARLTPRAASMPRRPDFCFIVKEKVHIIAL
jgi:hypothetical protein